MESSASGGFRVQAKRYFLTYPQCALSKDVLARRIESLADVERMVICEEKHEDGSPHLHAVVEFKSKFSSRNARVFDLEGHHPNIQTVKTWLAVVAYVKKAGDWEEYGNWDQIEISETRGRTFTGNLYEKAAELSSDEFFEFCRINNIPYSYANRAYQHRPSIFTLNNSEATEDVKSRMWPVLQALENPQDDFRSVCIIGPSGCGKTTWAKLNAEQPMLFVRHVDCLKKLGPQHKSIIFDDMCFKHFPRVAQIHIADRYEPTVVHIRYNVVEIPAGLPRYFLGNYYMFDPDEEAVNRRLVRYNIERWP